MELYLTLQFAQSSIAQLEKTRASQQSQITTLQSQVQTLEVTIQTLGRYVADIFERNIDLDLPSDVRRIVQQLDDIEKQRKKPIFVERKLGKSLSVNSNLGYPLKVLEELNEREGADASPIKSKKTPFFENTYEQLRQQRSVAQRPNRLLENTNTTSNSIENQVAKYSKSKSEQSIPALEKNMESINLAKSPGDIDSGVGTPNSPPEAKHQINDKTESTKLLSFDDIKSDMHPLSVAGEVNVRFNGTTQLKTLRSANSKSSLNVGSPTSSTNSDQALQPIKLSRS